MVRGFAVQFNWIFVLIAGGLILSFFFGVAMKQRSLSEERLSVTLSSDLENILTSAVVSEGTAQVLPVPSKGLSFECSRGCDCRFSVGGASKSFSDLVIFGPSDMERDGLVWSVDWSFPYRITNLLFIASPEIMYYFVGGDSRVMDRIVRRLPPQLDYRVVSSVSEISDEGFDRARFVFFSGVETPPGFFEESSGISLEGNIVSFYDDGWVRVASFPFAGDDLFLGAVFSDDVMFGCNLRSAFSRASNVASVMSGRASGLQSLSDSFGSSCFYDGAVGLLDQQSSLAASLSVDLKLDGLSDFDRLASQVEQVNRNLVRQSCPGLF